MTDPTLPADLRAWLSGHGKGWEATEPGSLVVRALARIEALEGVLAMAEAQFRAYAEQHLAKTPPDEAKAKTNTAMADNCARTLTGGNTP